MKDKSRADDIELPIITVFGAGIAGLTVAHELVERGFTVQVVEPQEDDFEEYQCSVGGLAANQFCRVRAPLSDVQKWLVDKNDKSILTQAEIFRAQRPPFPESTSRRFPLRESIRFNKAIHSSVAGRRVPAPPHYDEVPSTPYEPDHAVPTDWKDYWDDHGTVNRRKLLIVLATIRNATLHYMARYFPVCAQLLALGRDPSKDDWTKDGVYWIEDVDDIKKFAAREALAVRIVGYTDTDGTDEDNRRLGYQWATSVCEELIALNDAAPKDLNVWYLRERLDIVTRGSANPRYDQSDPLGRRRSNRVEFETIEQIIPGEHGFRFFPAFYRHLFDTMRRTPLLDSQRDASGATAFDQLVPTPLAQLALNKGKSLQNISFPRFSSFREFDESIKLLFDQLGFTPKDLLGLQYFVLRYLMSCPDRRIEEAEPTNLINYIGGSEPKKRFSEAALNFIDRAPRALAAMSARESDARTQLNITIQLMLGNPMQGLTSDMTLNGPTTPAWLTHWKTYLRIQGVKFFVGKIQSLRNLNGRFVPDLAGPQGWTGPCPECPYDRYLCPAEDGTDIDNHRFVLAVPFKQASKIISCAHNAANDKDFAAPFRQVIEFSKYTQGQDFSKAGAKEPIYDPITGKPAQTYPLRTISGLQFFFPQDYRVGNGNVYFADAPWALTAISQFSYWRQRVKPVGDFLGQMSVDVGDWFAPIGNSAWRSSRSEIANNTWEQVRSGLPKDYADVIMAPSYYHIDQNIVFEEIGHSGFRGSALLRIVPPAKSASASIEDTLEFQVSVDKWNSEGSSPPPKTAALPLQFVRQSFASGKVRVTAKALADSINKDLNDLVFATPAGTAADRPSSNDVLVSPTVRSARVVIAFRGTSKSPCYIVVNNSIGACRIGKTSNRLAALRKAVADFRDPIDIRALGEDVFEIKLRSGVEFSATVINIDAAIELLDGPQLSVSTNSNVIQLLNQTYPGSGLFTRGVIRGNASLLLSPPGGAQAGRRYGIRITAGAERLVDYEASESLTATEAADELRAQLQQKAGARLALGPPPANTSGILLSFNRDRGIGARETSSPDLRVIAKDLLVSVAEDPTVGVGKGPTVGVGEDPTKGFLVQGNDAEFLINVEGQWGARPGLFRGAAAKEVPKEYSGLAGCFGNNNTEIYYGHPDSCALLQYWVAAGTYMATYTRLTTMEAANESGRHAAAALIYKLRSGQKKGSEITAGPRFPDLVGDLPMIWNVEDCEPPDLKFFTELDSELFKAHLPHVLDILSLTSLINSLLELQLSTDQTKAIQDFLEDCRKMLESLRGGLCFGVLMGGQSFANSLGLYAKLTQQILRTTPGTDQVSQVWRDFLSRSVTKAKDLENYYSALWHTSDQKK
jgi:hypothetical protein